MRCQRILPLCFALAVASALRLPAADVSYYGVVKSIRYQQTNANPPVVYTPPSGGNPGGDDGGAVVVTFIP